MDPFHSPAPGDLDTDRARALEHHARDERPGPDPEVRALAHDRVQVRPSGTQPATAMDVPIERGEPLLAVAVDVLGQRIARFLDALEERREQGVRRRAPLEDQRPVVAAPRVVGSRRETGLHPLEVGQAMRVVPRGHAGVRGPALVVERVAALEDLPVDAAAAAQHLAPGVEDPSPVHERLGFGFVAPVVEAAADREREGRGHMDERVDPPIRATGLQDEDPGGRIG